MTLPELENNIIGEHIPGSNYVSYVWKQVIKDKIEKQVTSVLCSIFIDVVLQKYHSQLLECFFCLYSIFPILLPLWNIYSDNLKEKKKDFVHNQWSLPDKWKTS